MGKNYSEILHSIKNTGNNFTEKQMFDRSEKLIVGQSNEIYWINATNWEHSSWKFLSLVGDEQVIGLNMMTTKKWLERNKTLPRCGKYSTKKLIWENQHHFSIMCIWVALNAKPKRAEILWTITEPCLNPEFPQEQPKTYHARKIWVSLRGLMTWKVMPWNVWNDIVSWQTRRLNNSTKYQRFALMTISFKKKTEIRKRIVKKYVLKLFWNVYT